MSMMAEFAAQVAQPRPPGLDAVIHAELTADGKRIVVLPEGNAWGLKLAAGRLKALTPACEFARVNGEPAGAVYLPATWAAVVQLGFTFNGRADAAWRPGPALADWITAETTWRTLPPPEPLAGYPPWMTPRAYQVDGAAEIAQGGKFLVLDDPGTGKTVTTVTGIDARRLADHEIFPLLVVVPSWVVADHWDREIRAWAPGWGDPVMYGGKDRERHLRPGAQVLITTYATLRRDAPDVNARLVRFGFRSVVADECVPHDTLIEVPGGVKAICNIKPGDLVRGVDHATGRIVWTPVRHVMRSPLRPLVRIGRTRLTEDHPVWVSDSGSFCYGNAYAQPEDDADHLRAVRPASGETRAVSRPADAAILREKLLSPVADVPAGLRGLPEHAETASAVPAEHRAGHARPGVPRIHRIGPEPFPGPRRPGEGPRHAREPGLAPVEGRQRHGAYYPAGEAARAARAAVGAGTDDPDGAAAGIWLSTGLQGGHRAPGPESSDRSTREGARKDREPARPEETGTSGVPGLGGAVDLEQADPGRSLWNLETGTGNYFADGLLVHNCHLAKNARSAQSQALCRVARGAETFVGLSGTPVTRDTGDVYPLLKAMDPLSWPSRERMTRRYCERVEDDYGERITGLDPRMEPEFFAVLLRQMRRVAKADVLDQLPPKIYSVLRPEIPPEWEKAYKTMERDMLAQLPDGGELPVMTVLARLARLSQLASSACDVTVTQEPDPRTGLLVPKYHVTLKAPSWKAESLMDVIAARQGKPVVAFTVSRQLAMITGREYCEPAGLRTGYITGIGDGITNKTKSKARDDFQAGKLDVIVCTAGAGALGITLTASRTGVMLQRPFPLDLATQPEDRIHRIGAEIHDHVEIIDVVARGTVDERVRTLLREKAGQLSQFVRDPRVVRELLGGIT